MKIRGTLWVGFVWGFLFGIVGLWILAMLSLMLPIFEVISVPFFWPGRWMASLLENNGSMSTPAVVALFVMNGVLYGVVGVGVQWGKRSLSRK